MIKVQFIDDVGYGWVAASSPEEAECMQQQLQGEILEAENEENIINFNQDIIRIELQINTPWGGVGNRLMFLPPVDNDMIKKCLMDESSRHIDKLLIRRHYV